jgi:xanthine dehydrogenase YagR molybdenum-binding subunit
VKTTRRDLLKVTGASLGALPVLAESVVDPLSRVTTLAASERVAVTLNVNGEARAVEVAPLETLAQTLRERLSLTGTKLSCEGGTCGSCTVHVDGAPHPSCLSLALDMEGRSVRTIEGLAASGTLDPLQQAFIDADALQCGYCTPGMIMAARAFMTRWQLERGNAEPDDDTIARALCGNLCRCGAYPQILEAVRAACAGRAARRPGAHTTSLTLSRVDARQKVTGEARYAFDHHPTGMLHGVVVRAQVPHASVRGIDLSAAERMPGVKAAIRVLAVDKAGKGRVRYVGQELAAVAAATLEEAQAAARAVAVDLEALPFVVDPVAAAREGAPPVWSDPDDVVNAGEYPMPPAFIMGWKGNVRTGLLGNMFVNDGKARALASSSEVHVRVQGSTSGQQHATIERHVAVAEWKSDALTMTTGTQTVQALASDLAAAFDIPTSSVQVLSPYTGGAFGSKAGLKPYHVIAARLARAAGQPVRVALSPDEHLMNGGHRPSTMQVMDVGAKSDGTLTTVFHDARSNCGIAVGESASGMTGDHYAWSTQAVLDANVVTHAPPATPFRAPGFPANAFILEQAVDDVALRTRQNPLEMRLAQESRRRFRMVYRAALEQSGLRDRMSAHAPDKGRFARGVGVATAEWFVLTSPSAVVEVRAWRDGSVEISTASHDMGQGSRSVLANLVRGRLFIDGDKIRVRVGDSTLPTSPGSTGSITTTSIAPAAEKALLALEDELFDRGRRSMKNGRRVDRGIRGDDDVLTPWAALFAALPHEPFVTSGRRGTDLGGYDLPPRAFDPIVHLSPYAYAKDVVSSAVVVDVEVDRRLGRVRPLSAFIALDAGRLASPVTAHTQVTGAVMQGLSYALFEDRRLDGKSGQGLSVSLETYGIAGIADTPHIEVAFLDAPSEHNPAGVLGLGENSTIATSAAVGNAVARAIGRRIAHTPISPARVMDALR